MSQNKPDPEPFRTLYQTKALRLIAETIAGVPPPPGITLSPNSKLQISQLGKIPGVRNPDGTWSGRSGRWSETLHATPADLKLWHGWGASLGYQCRLLIPVDVDIDDAPMAAKVEDAVIYHFGPTIVRYRQGSPRRLLVYRRPDDHPPIRKRRIELRDPAGAKHAVEILGHGNFFVAHGRHPKGGQYLWRNGESPATVGLAGIPEITAARIEEFFA